MMNIDIESEFLRALKDVGLPCATTDADVRYEALRRLIRLRELWLEKAEITDTATLDDLLAWSAKREAEIRELLNIERDA